MDSPSPFFVVGTGRCGSTMLSDLLREHDQRAEPVGVLLLHDRLRRAHRAGIRRRSRSTRASSGGTSLARTPSSPRCVRHGVGMSGNALPTRLLDAILRRDRCPRADADHASPSHARCARCGSAVLGSRGLRRRAASGHDGGPLCAALRLADRALRQADLGRAFGRLAPRRAAPRPGVPRRAVRPHRARRARRARGR